MEFLRFGGSIPGEYWGCCACCIIQNFKQDPDTKASIQKVSGDGGGPAVSGGGFKFYGPTLRDIFWQRLREGTFGSRDMPNHAFLAILADTQLTSVVGKKWLAILKEAGFEFVRTVDNSVWSPAKNHIFGLFRNIGENGAVADQFTPPKAWLDLPKVKDEAWEFVQIGTEACGDYSSTDLIVNLESLTKAQAAEDQKIWDKIGPAKLLTEAELTEAGAPIIYAGLRTTFPPQKKEDREAQMKELNEKGVIYQPSAGTNVPY
jgi:hypothetical protein